MRDALDAALVLCATSIVQGAGMTLGWLLVHAAWRWVAA
jgi:hypothetical protein